MVGISFYNEQGLRQEAKLNLVQTGIKQETKIKNIQIRAFAKTKKRLDELFRGDTSNLNEYLVLYQRENII